MGIMDLSLISSFGIYLFGVGMDCCGDGTPALGDTGYYADVCCSIENSDICSTDNILDVCRSFYGIAYCRDRDYVETNKKRTCSKIEDYGTE